MSIPVELATLPAEISRFGERAFLVTNSIDRPPHVASVLVRVSDDKIAMGVGRTARGNATLHPAVTLMWTEGPEADYCLIVDGIAQPEPTEDFVVVPTSAVLHRLAR